MYYVVNISNESGFEGGGVSNIGGGNGSSAEEREEVMVLLCLTPLKCFYKRMAQTHSFSLYISPSAVQCGN